MLAGKPELVSNRLRSGLLVGRRILTGVVLMYAVVSLLVGGSDGARWIFGGALLAWAGIIMLPLAVRRLSACCFCWPRAGHFTRWLEIIAFNVALTLFVGEFGLRALSFCSGKSLILSNALESYRLTPGQDYGDGLRGNRLGYPGGDFTAGKPSGIFRIAALGDSFAVGPAVAFADNYLTRLGQRWPEVEVYNFGVSGTGPREYRFILNTDVWQYQPDLVLVSLFVGNDITEWLATPREMDPRQSTLYLCVTRSIRLCRERRRKQADDEPTPRHRLGGARLSEEAFREIESRRLALCITRPPATLEKKWRRALQYLAEIMRDCRAHRVPVAFILIPDEFQVNPGVLADALAAAKCSRTDVDLECPQRRLQAFFATQEVPCLDLLPAFLAHPGTYALRDTHWNERGNALAAACIGEWLPTVCSDKRLSKGNDPQWSSNQANQLAGAPPTPAP